MNILNGKNQIQLKTDCITYVPLDHYDDFTFIVNGEEFKTTRLISDLISNKVCQIHCLDPTFDSITINTQYKGHFSYILKLITFIPISIPENEIPFISEISEFLENDMIEFRRYDQTHETTLDNVFSLIRVHEQFSLFYSDFLTDEINFLASNFYQLNEQQVEELLNFTIPTLEKIIKNENLKIKDEDQLFNLVNKLYKEDQKCSFFYEYVIFSNISLEKVSEFLAIFDMNDITNELWNSLSRRLKHEVAPIQHHFKRYCDSMLNRPVRTFSYNNDLKFDGILNYLRKLTKGGIRDEVNITASSLCDSILAENAVDYEDANSTFQTNVEFSSWICFDFRDRRVLPTSYIIKSYFCRKNMNHPKSWVIEGSNDGLDWDIIDKKVDCPYLNGVNLVHSFEISIKINQPFQFIRMRLIDNNWNGVVSLRFDSFELYGNLY